MIEYYAKECLTIITIKDTNDSSANNVTIEIQTQLRSDCSSFNYNLIVMHIVDWMDVFRFGQTDL